MIIYSQLDFDAKKFVTGQINEEWQRFFKFKTHYHDRCIGYLFLLNAGGAVGIITHVGAAGGQAVNAGHKAALILFLAGIIFSMALNVLLAHRWNLQLRAWEKDRNDYYQDKIDLDGFNKRVKERDTSDREYFTVGCCAFVVWAFGIFYAWNAIF